MDQLPPEQLAILAQEDYGPLSRNIVYAFTAIAFVSVSLRPYTRLRYLAVGWEDYIIVVSMVCCPAALVILSILTVVFQFFSLATGVCQVLRESSDTHEESILTDNRDKCWQW
jgi:hypothetical protein